jgi:ABC-type dipeptide/oligopeptide/nickel transport system ATPase component
LPDAALEVLDLHTHFFTASGIVKALSGIDLRLEPGSMIGIVGESGAGKTTLASSIMCSVRPPGRVVAGQTRLFGRDLQQLTETQLQGVRGKEIAMIVPNPRAELNPLLPVGTQLANVARAHLGVPKDESLERAIDVLDRVRIPDPRRRANAYPHELSGGMAQRVVMAMALIASPRVIISDDATSGLDVTVQAQVLDLMAQLLTDNHAASLMITRDLGIVANYCDAVVVLYRGRVLEMAPLRSFFRNPRHPYSVELLAAFSYGERPSTNGSVVTSYDDDGLVMREIEPGHFVRDFD